jgi:hypothetical protein
VNRCIPIATVLLGTALVAPAAHAWPIRPLATLDAPGEVRAVAGLPDGRIAIVLALEGRHGDDTLELRIGAQRTVLGRAPYFRVVRLGQDRRGRLTAMWVTESDRRGGMRVRVWSGGHTTRLGAGVGESADLAVAPDGGAAVAWWSRHHVDAVVRRPGERAFGAKQDVTPAGDNSGAPMVAVGAGGRAVVASGDQVARTDPGTGVFGGPHQLLPRRAQGRAAVDAEAVALDDTGQTLVAVRTGSPSYESRLVQFVRWPAAATAPAAPVALSTRSPLSVRPVAVATGDRVTIAFVEGDVPEPESGAVPCPSPAAPLRLSAAVVTGETVITGGLDGTVEPYVPLLATRVGSSARVFFRAPDGIRAVRFDARARPGAPSAVTSDARRCVDFVQAAETGAGPAAVWAETASGRRGRRLLMARLVTRGQQARRGGVPARSARTAGSGRSRG